MWQSVVILRSTHTQPAWVAALLSITSALGICSPYQCPSRVAFNSIWKSLSNQVALVVWYVMDKSSSRMSMPWHTIGVRHPLLSSINKESSESLHSLLDELRELCFIRVWSSSIAPAGPDHFLETAGPFLLTKQCCLPSVCVSRGEPWRLKVVA